MPQIWGMAGELNPINLISVEVQYSIPSNKFQCNEWKEFRRSGAYRIFSGERKLLKLINLKGGILKDYTFNLSKCFDRLMHMNALRRGSISISSN